MNADLFQSHFRRPAFLHETAPRGSVAIVGAGPGDPELLTLRALRLLRAAEVVVYDRLIGPAILDLAAPDALKIFVGKAKGAHAMPQAAINALLVRQARLGRRVVRLKGGDPLIFGRGGEELAALKAAGIPVSVTPGITAASGCAAAAGTPLTHRDHAAAAIFVSGHAAAGNAGPDWGHLARSGHTLVFYMAVSSAGETAARLIAHGLDPATPVAIIENGTLPQERTLLATVAELAAAIAAHRVTGPALIVIGAVAALAETGCAELQAAV